MREGVKRKRGCRGDAFGDIQSSGTSNSATSDILYYDLAFGDKQSVLQMHLVIYNPRVPTIRSTDTWCNQ